MNRLRKKLAGSEILQALASFSLVMMARFGGTLATLAYTVIFVRLLSPTEFGAVSSLWSLAQVLVPLAGLNLGPVAIRAVVKARQGGDDALAAGFIAFTRKVINVTAPIAVVIYLIIVYFKFPGMVSVAPIGIALVALAILGMARVQTGAAIGVSLDRPAAAQIPRELVRPVMLLIVLMLFATFNWPLSLSMALALYASTVIVNYGLQLYLLRDSLAFTRTTPPRVENPRGWIATGMYLLPSRMVNDNGKIVMIVAASLVLPLDEVALITVALSISGLLNFAISSVETAFSAKLSRALHGGHRERATKFLAIAGAVKLLACAVMVAAVLFMLEPLLSYFGKHYTVADDITLILLLIPLAKAAFGKADLVLLVHDLRNRIFWIQLVTLALLPLSAVATLVLPGFGGTEVTSIGFVFAFFVGYAAMWWIALRQTGIDTSAPGAILQMLKDRKAA